MVSGITAAPPPVMRSALSVFSRPSTAFVDAVSVTVRSSAFSWPTYDG